MQIAGHADLPLLWTEWNAGGRSGAFDTTFAGPGVANTIRQCDGLVQVMSYWTFSDVFEEGGPIPAPFVDAFGLRAAFGINKPAFYDFALLHQLGDRRLANPSRNVIVTRLSDGTLVLAAWNIVDPPPEGTFAPGQLPKAPNAPSSTILFDLAGVPADARVTIQRVDTEHGNVLPLYEAMGKPTYPTPAQVRQLNEQTALAEPEVTHLAGTHLELRLEPNALALIRIEVNTAGR
jgi:xylan 1,4-beta-xylosidase